MYTNTVQDMNDMPTYYVPDNKIESVCFVQLQLYF